MCKRLYDVTVDMVDQEMCVQEFEWVIKHCIKSWYHDSVAQYTIRWTIREITVKSYQLLLVLIKCLWLFHSLLMLSLYKHLRLMMLLQIYS